MKKLQFLAFIGLSSVFFAQGCKKDDTEVIEPDKPSVAFEGSPDVKYAGTWKSEVGDATYTIDKSGSYKLDQTIQVSKQKPIESHLTGNWAIKGGNMLFKDQAGNVAAYSVELSGDKLTLTSTGSLKSKTVMNRKP